MDDKDLKSALHLLDRLERLYKQGTAENDVFLLRKVDKLAGQLHDQR